MAILFRFPTGSVTASADQKVAVQDGNGKSYYITVQDIIDLAVTGGVSIPSISDDGTDVEIDANLSVTGNVVMDLPTSDPGEAGQLWSNLGVVTISAG